MLLWRGSFWLPKSRVSDIVILGNIAYMYWVKEQLYLELLVAEATCAASAYLSSVLL